MKIAVINGSPKTEETSVTMSFIHYIQKLFPNHEFKILEVGFRLTNMKIKDKQFNEVIDNIKSADGVLWAFPVYTMLVPAQLKRFIELIWEKNAQNNFDGKYTAVLSTSMNFYDHTAHNYMRAISEDLNMKYIGFFSTQMFHMLNKQKRSNWYKFVENFLYHIENKLPTSKKYKPIKSSNFIYEPSLNPTKISSMGKKIMILTDYESKDSNLFRMISQFEKSFDDESDVEIVNLRDVDIKGGCMGCIKCGYDNKCFYSDGYSEFFSTKIANQQIMIFAAEIKDRYYSYWWKLIFDRMFHNGHKPSLNNAQMGFIISGPLNQIGNLQQLIDAQVECSLANLVDVVADDIEDSNKIDELLYNMAKNSLRLSELNYIATPTFLEVGGYKVFRDLIYSFGRVPFPSDFKYFKKNKMFDFPTKDKLVLNGSRFLSLFYKSKKIRESFLKRSGKIMVLLSNRVIDGLKLEKELELLS